MGGSTTSRTLSQSASMSLFLLSIAICIQLCMKGFVLQESNHCSRIVLPFSHPRGTAPWHSGRVPHAPPRLLLPQKRWGICIHNKDPGNIKNKIITNMIGYQHNNKQTMRISVYGCYEHRVIIMETLGFQLTVVMK